MNSERISPFWVNGYQPFSAHTIEVIGNGSLEAEVFLYNINGTLESYSPILNTDFTVLNLGTYSIQIQGDGWYAEGEVEIE